LLTRADYDEVLRQIPLLQHRSRLAWLMENGISAPAIAKAVGRQPTYIRKVKHAWWHRHVQPEPPYTSEILIPVEFLEANPARQLNRQLGLRDIIHDDFDVLKAWDVKEQVTRIWAEYASSSRFMEGDQALARLNFGRPARVNLVEARAFRDQKRAWFRLHAGYHWSGLQLALKSLAAYKCAGTQPKSAVEAAESALIAAFLYLACREHGRALQLLRLGEDLLHRGGSKLPPDFFRQRAIAQLFQGESGTKVRQDFRRAFESLPKEKKLLRKRHFFLLEDSKENWSWAREQVLAEIGNHYGQHSLYYCLNLCWAAAAGLRVNNNHVNDEACDLLLDNLPTFASFPDLARLGELLLLTPKLRVPLYLRQRWISHVVYSHGLIDVPRRTKNCPLPIS
jgi:hypothetical protein